MMSSLSLQLRTSPQLAFYLILLHGLGFFAVVLYDCSILIKMSLMGLVIAHGIYTCIYYAFLSSKKSVHAIELTEREEWLLHQKTICHKAKLLSDSLLTQYLIILNFKTTSFLNTSVVLMRDSISAEEWRRLRVYLNTH